MLISVVGAGPFNNNILCRVIQPTAFHYLLQILDHGDTGQGITLQHRYLTKKDSDENILRCWCDHKFRKTTIM